MPGADRAAVGESRHLSDPERAARRYLGTPTAAVNLIQPLREGELQLRGALLPTLDLQSEALEAQGARWFEEILISEAVPRFSCFALGAERRAAPGSARR